MSAFGATTAVAVEIEPRQCSPSLLALSTHVARAVPLFGSCVPILICISCELRHRLVAKMSKLVVVLSSLSCLLVLIAYQNGTSSLEETAAVTEPVTAQNSDETDQQENVNKLQEPDPSAGEQVDTQDDTWTDELNDSLETEYQLKKMISYLTPLMEIFHVHRARWHRSANEANGSEIFETSGRRRGAQYYLSPVYYPSPSGYNDRYADYGSASSYGGGYGGGCCGGGTTSRPV